MDPFVGEIRLMPYSFAPRGWALCQGQLLPIQQNTALFALLGTQYGGNGTTTFALPDLRGRAVVGQGQGPGLTNYAQGQMAGAESVTLLSAQIPAHVHSLASATNTVPASSNLGAANTPAGGYFAKNAAEQYGQAVNAAGNMAPTLKGNSGIAGGGQAHENRQPFLALNYCIATQGVFPQRQ